MELLNTNIEDTDIIREPMIEVKTYLQQLGIIYIDWKFANIGISDDGQLKLFDFDLSGLINVETNEWIIEPQKCWSYREAIENYNETPIDIDNYAFDVGMAEISKFWKN
jgi:serine/threonine protein kinase